MLKGDKIFDLNKYAWSEDKSFVKELNRRIEELQSGRVKGLSLNELEKMVKETYNSRKQNRNKKDQVRSNKKRQ